MIGLALGTAPLGWQLAGFFLAVAGAVAAAVSALWLARRRTAPMPHRAATLTALAATALWCVATAALGPQHALAELLEVVRNLAWIGVVYRLFAADGRHHAIVLVRPVIVVLALVEGLQLVLLAIVGGIAPDFAARIAEIGAVFRMLVAIGALVLLHNLYVGAAPGARQALRWPAAALAVFWAYELNLFTIAWLGGRLDELVALRGLVAGGVAVALVFGGSAAEQGLRLAPSRAVAFRTFSLAVIGGYLLLMAAISYLLTAFGEGEQRLTQVGFLIAATVGAVLWLPSRKLREWWRVTIVKHLFRHRYDYRAEWLRFTRTMGEGGPPGEALPQRAVRAMADVAESPSGLLLAPDEDGALVLAARWRWPGIEVPAIAVPPAFVSAIEREAQIVDVEHASRAVNAARLPDWLDPAQGVWALVPLLHFDRLQGVIVLARPPVPRRLDWEDFDLLSVVGRQLASYLAERSGQEALMEARQFDEFSRRIAFVMHDVKNLASQLSLLARNAERHADNPDFRADMLVTLRNSADKLNALLARLGRYGAGGGARRERVDLREVAGRVKARLAADGRIRVVAPGEVVVPGDSEAIEQALLHLAQNALDASDAAQTVHIAVASDGLRGTIEVIDSGQGMTADFVREGLFRPFVSSKPSGFGIGAFEARELVRAMGGRIDVVSREGVGTRFAISLPLFAAQELIRNHSTAIAEAS